MTEDSCLIVVFRWLPFFFVRLQEQRKLSSCFGSSIFLFKKRNKDKTRQTVMVLFVFVYCFQEKMRQCTIYRYILSLSLMMNQEYYNLTLLQLKKKREILNDKIGALVIFSMMIRSFSFVYEEKYGSCTQSFWPLKKKNTHSRTHT